MEASRPCVRVGSRINRVFEERDDRGDFNQLPRHARHLGKEGGSCTGILGGMRPCYLANLSAGSFIILTQKIMIPSSLCLPERASFPHTTQHRAEDGPYASLLCSRRAEVVRRAM